MRIPRLFSAALVSLSLAAPAVVLAAGQPGQCSLNSEYAVSSVKPYRTDENAGYSSYTRFRGADIYVVAEPGLTREWLQRKLESQVATGACDFGVRNATVDVQSAGGGFSVRVTSTDDRAADEILLRAQQLTK